MKKVLNFLFLSCKRASELIEKKAEKKLDKVEEVQLSVHLSMCKACSSWKTQSEKMDLILKNQLQQRDINFASRLSNDKKQIIINQLNQLGDVSTSS